MCHHDIFWLKRFPTLVTCVSCLSSVFSQMSLKQRWRCEDLQTHLLAQILELFKMFKLQLLPLLRVKMNIYSVCHHDIFWLKRFPALVTRVSCLSSVISQMLFNQRRCCEHLQTVLIAPILELLTLLQLMILSLLRFKMNIYLMCNHDKFWLKRFPTQVTCVGNLLRQNMSWWSVCLRPSMHTQTWTSPLIDS